LEPVRRTLNAIVFVFIGEFKMSKFANTATANTANTVNRAGGAAYKVKDAKKEIASVILASMLKGDSYYQSDASRIAQVFDLVKNLDDKVFAAKAMIYARHEGNLRSISHVLANAIAESNDGTFSLRNAIRKAIVRPDDMIEMFALWKSRHGEMIPNAMRRAFADLLGSDKWDAYQLKKYARSNQNVKLRDIILVSHPKDKDGKLKGVIEGNLSAPKTMENMLSEGKKASDTFEELLRENRLGYMAAVKNIRNALETGISDEVLDLWVKMISDRNRVMRSRMLPFRFVDAWRSVSRLNVDHFKLQKVKDAFDQALIHSAMNLDFVNEDDKLALILDDSGSMYGDPWKNAITLAAILYHALPRENVVIYKFSDTVKKVDFGTQSPIDIIFNTSCNGGGTYFSMPMQELVRTNTKVDKIIMLSDMQLYRGSTGSPYYTYAGSSSIATGSFDVYWNEYRNKVNSKVKMLFWDLEGYGSGTPLELKNGILNASGFSDKLLSVIPKMWKDQNALIKEIEEIRI
jgi:hypothetical protein